MTHHALASGSPSPPFPSLPLPEAPHRLPSLPIIFASSNPRTICKSVTSSPKCPHAHHSSFKLGDWGIFLGEGHTSSGGDLKCKPHTKMMCFSAEASLGDISPPFISLIPLHWTFIHVSRTAPLICSTISQFFSTNSVFLSSFEGI